MQVGDMLAGSLGILIFVVLCVCLARRKSESADLGQLEEQARAEETGQMHEYRGRHR